MKRIAGYFVLILCTIIFYGCEKPPEPPVEEDIVLLTLTEAPWLLRSEEYLQDGKVVVDKKLDQRQKTNLYHFYLKIQLADSIYDYNISGYGVYELQCNTGEIYGNGNWSFFWAEKNHILLDNESYLIVSLTPKEFIIEIEGSYYFRPVIVRKTYYRP